MKFSSKAFLYVLACLNVLLVFLATFNDKLQLPDWIRFTGRLHPLILHFPLAIIVLSVFIYLAYPSYRNSYPKLFVILFSAASLTAVLSALFGLFLSREEGYDPAILSWHLWLGVLISVISFCMLLTQENIFWKRITMVLVIPVLVIGSHFGAVLTHGEGYLSIKESTDSTSNQIPISDSSKIFTALIQPILTSKCYSCHNEKKAKGQLIMTSMAALLKGGKNGPLWVAGDPLNSHIIQRTQLPEDEKKHMPPRGKPQLSEKEIRLLEMWVRFGADTASRFIDYPLQDSFRTFLAAYIPTGPQPVIHNFPAADPDLIRQIKSPFCDITPVATGSPALAVRFMIRSAFNNKALQELSKLSEQVVSINCSDMPLTDKDLRYIKNFKHLETLILNGTTITGEGFSVLETNPSLQNLSVAGTKVTLQNIKALVNLKSLKNVYCWNTAITEADIDELEKLNGQVKWQRGFVSDPAELLRLTPPQVKNTEDPVVRNGDSIVLKHPMPGVSIRYTMDGTAPDSLISTLYNGPIIVNKASRLRAIAVRPGWLTSDTLDRTFFVKSKAIPFYARLNSKSDSIYKLSGAPSLADGKFGDVNITNENWIGFHGMICDASFAFEQPISLNEVVVSTLKKTSQHIFPPDHLELWAGDDTLRLKKISTYFPVQPLTYGIDRTDANVLKSKGAYRYYRIKVFPVKKLPKWHEGKGKKVWIFLDEIYFN